MLVKSFFLVPPPTHTLSFLFLVIALHGLLQHRKQIISICCWHNLCSFALFLQVELRVVANYSFLTLTFFHLTSSSQSCVHSQVSVLITLLPSYYWLVLYRCRHWRSERQSRGATVSALTEMWAGTMCWFSLKLLKLICLNSTDISTLSVLQWSVAMTDKNLRHFKRFMHLSYLLKEYKCPLYLWLSVTFYINGVSSWVILSSPSSHGSKEKVPL